MSATLRRTLMPTHIWALAFGCIIGGSAFFMPANTFLPTAGPLGTAIAMLAAACVMIVIAFNYHYMVNKIPEAGGEFSYAQSAFGRTHSFVCAWFLGLSYISLVPLNATLMGVVGKHLVGDVFRFGYMYSVAGFDVFAGEVLLSLSVIALFAWFNIRGVKTAGWVQMTLALSLIGGVFIVALAALFSSAASFKSLSPAFAPKGSILSGVLAVMAVSPWAFVGFDTIPQAAEEFNFSHAKTRIIMIMAILFGAAVYMTLSTVTASVVPAGYSSWVEYVGDVKNLQGIASLPTFNAAKSVLGTGGARVHRHCRFRRRAFGRSRIPPRGEPSALFHVACGRSSGMVRPALAETRHARECRFVHRRALVICAILWTHRPRLGC